MAKDRRSLAAEHQIIAALSALGGQATRSQIASYSGLYLTRVENNIKRMVEQGVLRLAERVDPERFSGRQRVFELLPGTQLPDLTPRG